MPALYSSAIGYFVIGFSSIGDQPFDYAPTVISQYANSQRLLQLIDFVSQAVDQAENLQAFYSLMWDLDTAEGFGLDVWGRILGIGRVLNVQASPYFSFQQAHNPSTGNPFGGGSFFLAGNANTNYALTDDVYRLLLIAKAAANICNCSIPAINQILMLLFPGLGNCYVTDDGNMGMSYTFGAPLSVIQNGILVGSGVLPRPTGVKASVVVL